MQKSTAKILFVTSYPPRECGIATYSQDLITALNSKFQDSFTIKICALENNHEQFTYDNDEVACILNVDRENSFKEVTNFINSDDSIALVVYQHEFGFYAEHTEDFKMMLQQINKKSLLSFHTILPNPDSTLLENVKNISSESDGILVMTENSKKILTEQYDVLVDKIHVIPHGTHFVNHENKDKLKEKYGFANRKVLTTFGLLSSGKSIETTLRALPEVVKTKPDVLFLIIGKTHPGVVKQEGEQYREFLEKTVTDLQLENHVKFINKYVGLEELMEYLQLTDIYLFTSKDPNQAVSGTFVYAASCGCAIISTPIPHAVEFLSNDSGLIIPKEDPQALAEAINRLLFDVTLRTNMRLNGLHKIMTTVWENSALSHARLFQELTGDAIFLNYKNPKISFRHIYKMTTDFGIFQFSKLNEPDRTSGYTLDDNARTMIAVVEKIAFDEKQIDECQLTKYLNFVAFCQQNDGSFLNYVDDKRVFTKQNYECNLEDSNGRAIWALGELINGSSKINSKLKLQAKYLIEKTFRYIHNVHSSRAMAFALKGLCLYNKTHKNLEAKELIVLLSDRLVQMYRHESEKDWNWFESYLTYANSVLPEALLLASVETQNSTYSEIAKESFDFLISKTFTKSGEIKVISNKGWYKKGEEAQNFGEQPIDVGYTILALDLFYEFFHQESYLIKMKNAFDWFLGRNHLNRTIYNPCTAGCFDGLEEFNVNLNQGAESTISYILARLSIEKRFPSEHSKDKSENIVREDVNKIEC